MRHTPLGRRPRPKPALPLPLLLLLLLSLLPLQRQVSSWRPLGMRQAVISRMRPSALSGLRTLAHRPSPQPLSRGERGFSPRQ